MIYDPVNKVTTITIQTSQFIHFQLHLQNLVANSSSRIYHHELEKKWQYLLKLGKGDSYYLLHIHSGKGMVVFKSIWSSCAQNKVWLV